jgi:hypothetical protein
VVLVLIAYCTGSPVVYHDTIMPIHGFAYSRSMSFLLGIMGPSASFVNNLNSKWTYALAAHSAFVLAISHSKNPYAVFIATMSMVATAKVGTWTRDQTTLCRLVTYILPWLIIQGAKGRIANHSAGAHILGPGSLPCAVARGNATDQG